MIWNKPCSTEETSVSKIKSKNMKAKRVLFLSIVVLAKSSKETTAEYRAS